jgi:hypothetical protein
MIREKKIVRGIANRSIIKMKRFVEKIKTPEKIPTRKMRV